MYKQRSAKPLKAYALAMLPIATSSFLPLELVLSF